ncbi:MAG: formate/nitrite transporter family protein [Beijerinckiaceae bacterium]
MAEQREPPKVAARQPPGIAEAVADRGIAKANRTPGQTLMLGILAGVYIGFGGMFAIVAGSGDAGAFGPAQVLAGAVFSLGLILVVIGGAELFTGNTLMILAKAEEKIKAGKLLRSWTLVWTANFVGSLALVALAIAAGFHTAGDGAVGARALEIAQEKTSKGFLAIIASGILANMLVCLAVWLAEGGRTVADKILAIILPIAGFVAMGLEHSVANMFLIPYGVAIELFAGPAFWAEANVARAELADVTVAGALLNIVAATIGNIIGGGLIALAYWAAYLRGS